MFLNDKMDDEKELICEFIDEKSTFNEKQDKRFIVVERANKLAKAINPTAIERQISSLKSSIMKLIANKKINTDLPGNLPAQLPEIFALFERDLFKNGLLSLYNAAVINAEGNGNCMIKSREHFHSSNFNLANGQQTRIKITNAKGSEEKFGFGCGQK